MPGCSLFVTATRSSPGRTWWGDAVKWYGTSGPPDTGESAPSLAWHIGDLYVIANAYWEPLTFTIQAPGPWCRVVDTFLASPCDIVEAADAPPVAATYEVAARSVVILERLSGDREAAPS